MRERVSIEVRQRDLFEPPCLECKGTGQVFFALNLPRPGQRRGSYEYTTCPRCLGSGHERRFPGRLR